MKRVGTVHDTRTAGGAARELNRRLDTFRSGIRKEDLIEIGHEFEQTFGQHPGECRDVKLHQVRQVAVEHALQSLA